MHPINLKNRHPVINALAALVRMVYPPRCAVCAAFIPAVPGQPAAEYPFFCPGCLSGWRSLPPRLCPVCGVPITADEPPDQPCSACRANPPHYDALRAPFAYVESLTTVLHRFKYKEAVWLARPLGGFLSDFACSWLADRPDMLVLPVPLHPRRLRRRGFNQSLLLARPVAAKLRAKLDYLVLRRRLHTASQTGLGHDARAANVRNAFELRRPSRIKGREILLVDDVATTGSTMNECARILKQAGARRVLALALARAVL